MKKNWVPLSLFTFPLVSLILSLACTLPFSNNSIDNSTAADTIYETEILIWVEVPGETPEDEIIQLIILDEVSGLNFNSKTVDMLKVDDTHHGVVLRVQVGTVLKYRFARSGESKSIEQTSDGETVRYRMYYADSPGEVHDIVSKWEDTDIIRGTGKIIGLIGDVESNEPIENMLILVGGQQVFSKVDGSFEITGLPSGQHQLVAYSTDGNYKTFKQNVIIEEDLTTPVTIHSEKSIWVDVVITVNVPENTVPAVPLRLTGNLNQSGNSFIDLGGSIGGNPKLMQMMNEIETNQYQVVISLPIGADFRYKFTLGDGFWNAERNIEGELVTRQFIVPANQTQLSITDTVISWNSVDFAGIWFDLNVPKNLSDEDKLFLQFKQEDWLSPIPMWHIQEYRWAYKLLGPTGIGDLIYRYCVNEICEGQNSSVNDQELIVRKTRTDYPETSYLLDEIIFWD